VTNPAEERLNSPARVSMAFVEPTTKTSCTD
jgi:hypothetical protein